MYKFENNNNINLIDILENIVTELLTLTEKESNVENKEKRDIPIHHKKVEVKKETPTLKTYFSEISDSQQKRINSLVDEYLKTVIMPNCEVEITPQNYKALFEGLRNYSAWIILHK